MRDENAVGHGLSHSMGMADLAGCTQRLSLGGGVPALL